MLDALPGSGTLAFLASVAAGEDDRYADASDDELDGVIAAWDRLEAYSVCPEAPAIAEFIRRRAEKGCEAENGGMPQGGMSSRWMSCGCCWRRPSRGRAT